MFFGYDLIQSGDSGIKFGSKCGNNTGQKDWGFQMSDQVLDIKEWQEIIRKPALERNIQLFQAVTGHQVCGWMVEDYEMGLRSPHSPYVMSDMKDHLVPVYIRECVCEKMHHIWKDPDAWNAHSFLGHSEDCFAAVPEYHHEEHQVNLMLQQLTKKFQPFFVTIACSGLIEGWAVVVHDEGHKFKAQNNDYCTVVLEAVTEYLKAKGVLNVKKPK